MAKFKKVKNLIEQKLIPLSEEVLCKDGWKKAEHISTGEEVYGIDGLLHKVEDITMFNDKKNI